MDGGAHEHLSGAVVVDHACDEFANGHADLHPRPVHGRSDSGLPGRPTSFGRMRMMTSLATRGLVEVRRTTIVTAKVEAKDSPNYRRDLKSSSVRKLEFSEK